ncbi:CpaD family pilus assembly lipoprotein [Rhizosaccharibacter radicis]|uniref:CpaD family pilus assembly protein n=1 Tax=Rhizosaccharibacter radicis TaxID=2782605 RepID=A0ABT1VTX0_9PROT|nr:CpaD family pilus assembly protein [Acetobacteraceae bacterium KSS12]
MRISRFPSLLMAMSSAALALPLLAGCDDPAYERGVPPAIALNQSRMEVPLFRYGAARLLRQQIGILAPDGNIHQLDASIRTTSVSQRDATRAVLIQMGLDPSRIDWVPVSDNAVVLSRTRAVTTPCSTALKADWQGDVANSVTSLGTCVQANNLAQMVSDPRDLARPVTLGPNNGAVAARAVRDWENGEVRQPSRRGQAGAEGAGDGDAGGGDGPGGGGGGGGGGAVSAIPAGPAAGAAIVAPAPAAAAGVNPLLSAAPLSGAASGN